MGNLERFLRMAFPTVPPETVDLAAAELRGPSADEVRRLKAELDEFKAQAEALQRDNVRLHAELAGHRDGIMNASKAGLDVLAERARHRRMEGYNDAHDDAQTDFTLTAGALAYALDAYKRGTTGRGFDDRPPEYWPWEAEDWRPKELRRNLVNGASMLIAEIERLDRAALNR